MQWMKITGKIPSWGDAVGLSVAAKVRTVGELLLSWRRVGTCWLYPLEATTSRTEAETQSPPVSHWEKMPRSGFSVKRWKTHTTWRETASLSSSTFCEQRRGWKWVYWFSSREHKLYAQRSTLLPKRKQPVPKCGSTHCFLFTRNSHPSTMPNEPNLLRKGTVKQERGQLKATGYASVRELSEEKSSKVNNEMYKQSRRGKWSY